MAVFNPDVPDVRPQEYTRDSKPIQNIPASIDESGKTIGNTIGSAISGLVEVADSTVKSSIKNDVHQQIDPIQDSYTAALKQARDTILSPSSTAPADTASTANLDLLPAQQPLPQGLKNGLAQIETIGAASKDPKVTETLYLGKLYGVLKNLRSQYPGYRDVVDDTMQRATGRNVANAYQESIISDLNKSMAGLQTQHNEIEKLFAQNIDILDPAIHSAWVNGKITDENAWGYIAERTSKIANIKNLQAQMALQSATRGAMKDTAEDYANSVAGDIITKNWSAMKFTTSANTPQTIQAIVQAAQNGDIQMSDTQAEQLSAQNLAFRTAAESKIRAELGRVDPKTGLSAAKIMGPTKTNEIINGHLALFDELDKAFHAKDSGLAYAHMHQAEAINNDTKHMLLTSNVGDFIAKIQSLSQMTGGNVFTSEFLIKNGLLSDADGRLKALVLDHAVNAAVQPDLRKGKPSTLAGSVDDAQAKGVVDPGTYKSFMNIVQNLTGPNSTPEMKQAAAIYGFDPRNRGLLNKFDPDYVDPVTGQHVSGRQGAFAFLTQPQITKSMWEEGQKNPQIWNNYKGWAQDSFMHQLFPQELNNLKEIQNTQNRPDPNTRVHLSWSYSDHQFILTDAKGANITNSPFNYGIDKLNWGIKHLTDIAKQEGSPPDQYIFKVLKYYGFTPRSELDTAKDVINKSTGDSKKSNLMPEQDNSIETFTHNPTGTNNQRNVNLSNEQILGITTYDIPEDMSPQDFINHLRQQGLLRAQREAPHKNQ